MGERDKLVHHHALTQQRSDRSAVVPRDTHHPGDRPEYPPQHRLQSGWEPRDKSVNPAEQSVDERDECDERNQHRDHIEHQLQTFACAAGCRIQHVHVGARDVHFDTAEGLRDLGLRLEDLRHHDRPWRRHDDRRQQMTCFDPKRDVRGHNRSGNVRHTGRHHGHKFRASHARQEWTDREGRLGLSHEN